MNILLIVVALLILLPTLYASVIAAPLAITSRRVISDIVNAVQLSRGEKFYELGTGTGRVSAVFGKKGANVVGYELSPLYFLITWLNLKLRGVQGAALRYGNFFNADLSDADIVFCFLMPKAMDRLREKFDKELKRGARVVSYAFPIEGYEPYAVIRRPKTPAVFFYRK